MAKYVAIDKCMTPAPHSVGPDQTLKTAQELMHRYHIRHLPVRHQGRIIGILSERDIDFALRVDEKSAGSMLVEDALNAEVFSVMPSTPLRDVVERLGSEKIGCALVEDAHGKLLGIFTLVDVCRVLVNQLDLEL